MLSKEYPWLFAPRTFFFGLWQVPQWGYDCGYSKAYIELMCMDTTILHYLDKEDNKTDKQMKIDEATRVYYERKKQKEKQTTSINLK